MLYSIKIQYPAMIGPLEEAFSHVVYPKYYCLVSRVGSFHNPFLLNSSENTIPMHMPQCP